MRKWKAVQDADGDVVGRIGRELRTQHPNGDMYVRKMKARGTEAVC